MNTTEALNNALEFVEELDRELTLSSNLELKRGRLEQEIVRALAAQSASAPAADTLPRSEFVRTINALIEGEALPESSLELLRSIMGAPAAQPVGEPKGIGMGAQALAGELAAALNADLGTENAIGMLGANTMAWLRTVACVYLAQPAGSVALPKTITEEMHAAACKVLVRAHGLDGLPQRMLDAMRAAAPQPVVDRTE